MSSIDHRDAQVQTLFTSMKKLSDDLSKFKIAQKLARMYEKSDDYTYGIFSRTYKFIAQSNDKQQKKIGLMVLAKLGQRIQGVARTAFVNKFYSPIFKLFQNNLQQSLIQYLQLTFQIILQVGANRNDSVIQSNLTSILQLLNNNVKDPRKMCAYSILKILVIQSPYITFKRILQKQKNKQQDNLLLITSMAKSKNIKLRKSYLLFLTEYIKYIAEKKDRNYFLFISIKFLENFQKLSYERLLMNSFNHTCKEFKDNNEEYVHLYLETIIIFLKHLNHIILKQGLQIINKVVIQKITSNKNMVIQKSLITVIPLILTNKNIQQISITICMDYLRQIKGDDQIIAHTAINQILQSYHKNRQNYMQVYCSILSQISLSLRNNILNHQKNHQHLQSIAQCQIRTIYILIKCHTSMNYSQLISKQCLDEIVSYSLLISLQQQTLKLIHEISKQNIHNLGQILQKKLILMITKILTGTVKKILRQIPEELKEFIQLMDKMQVQHKNINDIQMMKTKAIEALSRYRFREEFRDVVGGFVRDKVLKTYLQWGNAKMRNASVQAAFFLCVKKGKIVAVNQMLQILQKLIRVGMTDNDEFVRQKVFSLIHHNLLKHQQFHQFFSNIQILNCLFQSTQDKNEHICLISLKIICFLHKKSTSPLIIPFLKKIAYNNFYHFSSNFKYYTQKKYCIKSFSILIQHAPFIIQNHVNILLQLLLKYLQDRVNYQGLQTIFFQMFKALTQSLSDSIIPYVQKISIYLIDAMKDKLNTKKRNLSLKTFVSIIKNCGYVILPYFQLNNLQQTLIYLLRSQIEQQSRNDLMRIIGGLGMVDKYQMKNQMKSINNNNGVKQIGTEDSKYNVNQIISKMNFIKIKRERQAEKIEYASNQQLKIYYDELLLLQNNTNNFIKHNLTNKKPQQSTNNLFISSTNPKPTSTSMSLPLKSTLIFPLPNITDFNMVILKNLFAILSDISLSQKHQLTLDILTSVIQLMGNQLQPQLQKIFPLIITLTQSNNNQQILQLIIILSKKCNIEQFLGNTVYFVLNKVKSIELVLNILDVLTCKYSHSLRHYLEALVDKLYVLVQENLNDNIILIKIIKIYNNLKELLEPYLSTILIQFFDRFFHTHSQVTNYLIDFLILMSKYCGSLLQFMPQIIHHFCNLLTSCHQKHSYCRPCLRNKICNCIVKFIIEFNNQFLVYLPLIHKYIIKCQQTHQLYNKAIRHINLCNFGNIKTIFTNEQLQKFNIEYKQLQITSDMPKFVRKIQGAEELIHQFDPFGKKLVDSDWIEWLKKTAIFLLKKSPNIILRACSDLADQYSQLGLELYNISFYYFWEILLDEQKKNLIDNLKKILQTNPKPFLLVRKTILNLAQFMNRKKCSFQINSSLLADSARDSSSYAKHLYYRQLQFQVIPQKTIQKLIEVSMKLGQPQNAYGMFRVAGNLNIQCKVEWYEKIQKYQQAYIAYTNSNKPEHQIPRLKCLSYINDEKFLEELNENIIKNNSQIASLAANSYANLQQWNLVEQCIIKLDEDNEQKNFWQAIINVKKQNYTKSLNSIIKTRKNIYQQISQLINFTSSGQPTQKLIKLQQLFQLQQLINIKLMSKKLLELKQKFPQQQQTYKYNIFYDKKVEILKQIWDDRLIGASQKQNNWVKLVYVRSLLFDKVEYFNFYYQYCEICIKEKKINKFEKMVSEIKRTLKKYQQMQINNKINSNNNNNNQIITINNSTLNNPSTSLLNIQSKLILLQILQIQSNFTQSLIIRQQQIDKIIKFLDQHSSININKISQIYALCAKTFYDMNESVNDKTILLYEKSAKLSGKSKDLNMLALMHLEAAKKIEGKEQYNQNNQNNNIKQYNRQKQSLLHQTHIFQALKSLLQSLQHIQSQNSYVLQGFLKVLSLIKNFSHKQRIYNYFMSQFKKIPIQGWINIVPQMIAQLVDDDLLQNGQKNQKNFIKILKQLLLYLGHHHPQSVLFSLNFAVKSKIPQRVAPASLILQKISLTHPQLTLQSQTISSQLCKAAIKLKQFWYDGIQSAWSIYNQNKSAKKVVEMLKQLCQEVMSRKSSNSELAFHQQFQNDLQQAYSWLKRYEKYNDIASFSQAFQIFYSIYKRVKDSFQTLKKVYLKNVAPELVTTKNYLTTIPGLYQPNKQGVKINGFSNQLTVLQSKQRPRKLTIYGDDNKQYNFLLKGRQDLRLDQRVMQFLNLVNKLLSSQRQTLKKDLTITKYSIIPLTLNTGLIGWVQNCDTLNQLIKQYRQVNKIRMYVQKQLYQKMCPQYAYLPVINKLQIFKNGLQSTQGKDLAKILWSKSQTSESWIQRRTNYTTSLATMSIVGYILGLGDRHPSNIMIKRDSGKIVHIDFGDCFEVAVLRQKFPQKVPFRLTRMLQKAMGVAGINGLYRATCESVMRILRDNKQSLLAVLETFVHDPIISWRITLDKNQNNQQAEQNNPFPEKKKQKQYLLGSIMNNLQKQLNNQKAKQNDNVLIPKTMQMQAPIKRHHEPKQGNKQIINQKAVKALNRIKQKLKGKDFEENVILTVEEQVNRLINQAISHENICQSWPGWCPFW